MLKRLLPLVLALSGCVSVNESVLVDRSSQPVPMDDVQVLTSSRQLPESCERVAYLDASASESFNDTDDVVAKLKKTAGKLGANVVTVQETYGTRANSSMFDSHADREFEAEAFWCPDGIGEAGG